MIIEVFFKDSNKNKINKSIRNITDLLDISELTFNSITSQDIENFDRIANQVTHESREGDEAFTTLTRADYDKDTRNESARAYIEDRPFRLENGIIKINDIQYNIGLKRGKKGIIQFKRHIPPNEQIQLSHEIFRILRWD